MQDNNLIINKGICRNPVFSSENQLNIDENFLNKWAQNEFVLEAISVASYDFYNEVKKWIGGKIEDQTRIANIYQTLYKYYVRSSTRCTPFGLFSSISFIKINQTENQDISLDQTLQKLARLDICAFQSLIDYFSTKKELNGKLKYLANNTIYKIGDEYRYFERKRVSSDIHFELSKVEINEFLIRIINFCNEPKSVFEIRNNCFENEFSDEEIFSFINDLISEKILVSELEFGNLDTNYLENFIIKIKGFLKDLPSTDIDFKKDVDLVENISITLKDSSIPLFLKYKQILGYFEVLEVSVKPQDLIHVDLTRNINNEIFIPDFLTKELLDVKQILAKLSVPKGDPFKKFKEDYYRRYEERTMPLLHVLDPETGIGFEMQDVNLDKNFLLNGIRFGSHRQKSESVVLHKKDIYLFKKLKNNKDNEPIEILESELATFNSYEDFDNTTSAFFSLLKNNKIVLNEFSGSSAINFMSRFSHLDNNIDSLCKEISKFETHENIDFLIAEISHVSELKAGNLVISDLHREFLIPCVNLENNNVESVLLSDIFIKIDNSEIQLFSKKHGKRILPKLSNSLNFNRNSISVFRFLSEIQFQKNIPSLEFEWGGMLNLFDFFPRVNYKNIILSPAMWIIRKEEIQFDDFENSIGFLKEERNIPNCFFISRSPRDDNKLFIDLQNEIALDVLKKEIQKADVIYITESFLTQSVFKEKPNKWFNNEIVLPLFLEKRKRRQSVLKLESKEIFPAIHQYAPGSEWLSMKIYLGIKNGDDLIQSKIHSLISDFSRRSLITKWFFVRYFDEDFHIRIRFYVKEKNKIQAIIDGLHGLLSVYLKNDIIHNIVFESYKRENERYRPEYIEHCESLFYTDSETVISLLKFDPEEDKRWKYAVLGIDAYLDDFKYELNEKVNLLNYMFSNFFIEFKGDKNLSKQLDKKFRANKAIISRLIFKKEFMEDENNYYTIFKKRSMNNEKIINQMFELGLSPKNEDLTIVISIMHMFLNRLFMTNNRQQELVMYYLLAKHYESVKQQLKQQIQNVNY